MSANSPNELAYQRALAAKLGDAGPGVHSALMGDAGRVEMGPPRMSDSTELGQPGEGGDMRALMMAPQVTGVTPQAPSVDYDWSLPNADGKSTALTLGPLQWVDDPGAALQSELQGLELDDGAPQPQGIEWGRGGPTVLSTVAADPPSLGDLPPLDAPPAIGPELPGNVQGAPMERQRAAAKALRSPPRARGTAQAPLVTQTDLDMQSLLR